MSTIAPNDANIIYSPFNWDVQSARAKTINPGAYLRTVIDGGITSLVANFDMTSVVDAPQINYRVDNGPWTTATVAATVTLSIPATNAWTSHVVEIVVKCNAFNDSRWTTDATSVKFTGFTCSGGTGGTTRVIQKRGLNVLVYGDSITEGLYTLLFTSSSGYNPAQSDAQQGFAYNITGCLGAEVGVVGFGGTGLEHTYTDVPSVLTTWNKLFNTGTPVSRSFTTPVPDVVVINEGTNDSAVSSGTFQTDYVTLLNDILGVTPSTTVIVAMRPFNGTHASDVQAACASCSQPSRVYYADTTGWHSAADEGVGLHPYGYDDAQNLAQRTTAAIRSALASLGPMFICTSPGTVKGLAPYRG